MNGQRLDAKIRAALDERGHEDWCPGKVHADCCAKDCECELGARSRALLAVLDFANDIEDRTYYGFARAIRERIATALEVQP